MLKRLKAAVSAGPLGQIITRRRFWAKANSDIPQLPFYKQFVSPGSLVFDVGANRGNRTRVFSLLGARVVAFEPQPQCCEFLRRMCHGKRNITVVQKAIGETVGTVPMIISKTDTLSTLSRDWINAVGQSGRFDQWEPWKENEEILVEVTTLEKSIEEFGNPEFAKIDVEGYEIHVLRGLNRPLRALSIEFAGEYLSKAQACIETAGTLAEYEYQFSLRDSMCFESPAWSDAASLLEKLQKTAAANPKVWGDIYMRLKGDLDQRVK